MSSFRRHFKVSWNDGDPVDVVTNAWDLADAREVSENPVIVSFAMVHHALERYGHNVPPFKEFVEQLDEISRTDGEEEELGPTVPMAYTGEPSQLQS